VPVGPDVIAPAVPLPELPKPLLSGPLPVDLQPRLEDARKDLPESYSDGCHQDYGSEKLGDCVYGKRHGDVTVALVGDSHAAQWLPAIERLADERDWRLLSFTKSGCPMVDVTVWNSALKREYRECDDWREAVLDRLRGEHVTIAFVANADMYEVVDEEGHRAPDDQRERWEAGLASSLARIGQEVGRLVVIGDTPRLGYDPLECLATHADLAGCDTASSGKLDPAYAAVESDVAAAAGAQRIAVDGWICPDGSCPLVRGSMLVFRDDHHLTATFAAVLADRIGAALDGTMTTS
jgi:hypothetical protein